MAQSALSALIRREISQDANRRFLRRMPAFHADTTMEARFDGLLRQLEMAEQKNLSRG